MTKKRGRSCNDKAKQGQSKLLMSRKVRRNFGREKEYFTQRINKKSRANHQLEMQQIWNTVDYYEQDMGSENVELDDESNCKRQEIMFRMIEGVREDNVFQRIRQFDDGDLQY